MATARDTVRHNSYVLFYYSHSKKWLTKVERGGALHTHIGVLSHADAIGKEYGSRIVTNKSKYVYLLRPTLYDHVMRLQHGTQIVYPKEIGHIVARAGIGSGQRILEIGTGSGSLTSFVANIARPRGHVYSFDVDESFIRIAQKNIDKAGVAKYVTLHNMDIKKLDAQKDEMPVQDADVALIDLGDPWEVIPHVRRMLRGSGCVFAVCPTMNQLEKLAVSLVENEFTNIESTEQIIRNIEARPGKTRHSFDGIGHTTYLCFARKAYFGRDVDGKGSSSSSNKGRNAPDTKKSPPPKSTRASKTARRGDTSSDAGSAKAAPARTPAKKKTTGAKAAPARTPAKKKTTGAKAGAKDRKARRGTTAQKSK